ncbi:MAG: T9SS type A sorting domain-containing protein [Bacteroidia bacterium]
MNALNYVKLELGNIGYSNTISVVVVKAIQEVFVVPHPVESNSILHFKNKEKASYVLKMYNALGQVILTTETNDEEIDIGRYSLPQGLVYYDLYTERKKGYRGKLLVKH